MDNKMNNNKKNVFRHVNFEVTKAVIVASPGFVKQQFFDYMYQQVGVLFSA
jgi:stalled ribosome rescue protein Dom34